MKGITLREPPYVAHEDKGNNSSGGYEDEADNAVKTLLALNEHKDNNSCRGSDDVDNEEKTFGVVVGDHAFMKVTPTKGVGRAIRSKELSPKLVGPYQIIRRIV